MHYELEHWEIHDAIRAGLTSRYPGIRTRHRMSVGPVPRRDFRPTFRATLVSRDTYPGC